MRDNIEMSKETKSDKAGMVAILTVMYAIWTMGVGGMMRLLLTATSDPVIIAVFTYMMWVFPLLFGVLLSEIGLLGGIVILLASLITGLLTFIVLQNPITCGPQMGEIMALGFIFGIASYRFMLSRN